MIAKKYLKKWLNIPARGATDTGIFHPYLLNVKQPSQLYLEGHMGNYTMMRMKGDKIVNAALDSQLERESRWTHKSSTITLCNTKLQDCITNDQFFIPTTENTFDLQYSREIETPKAKASIKLSIKEDILNLWNTRIQSLVAQGDFGKLLIEEQNAVTWQSIIRKVPRTVMSFAIRCSTNTLATPDNLRRWGKRRISQCPLCSNEGTLDHILNFCPVATDQGRTTWRHNSILEHVRTSIVPNKPEHLEVFTDLPGCSINGATIPQDILVVSGQGSKPDLVLLNRKEKKITVLELTSPLEHNIENAYRRKLEKYTPLKTDLEEKGFNVSLVPFEIGSRGYVSKRNRENLITVFVKNNIKYNVNKMCKELSKISLLCSFGIFHAYQSPSWTDPPLMKV
jgi:hypothetical protein